MSIAQAKVWTKFACQKNDVVELFDKIDIKFCNRMTSSMGLAIHHPIMKTYKMKLSNKIWRLASKDEQEDTIVHEACHLINAYKYGKMNYGGGTHGSSWIKLMENCGFDGRKSIHHNVDVSSLKRRSKPSKYFICGCENPTRLGPTQYKRWQNGATYRCGRCKVELKFELKELNNAVSHNA